MYLQSGTDYYLTNLEGITIQCKSGLSIISPKIKFKLLSYPDINKVNMMIVSGMSEPDINEEIVNKCILSLVGFEEESIDFENSPGGVVDNLATKVRLNSELIIKDIEDTYQRLANSLSLYERLAMTVSYYTNNTYEFTQNLPIDELVKRYTACSLCFSGVPPLIFEKEEESKVG